MVRVEWTNSRRRKDPRLKAGSIAAIHALRDRLEETERAEIARFRRASGHVECKTIE